MPREGEGGGNYLSLYSKQARNIQFKTFIHMKMQQIESLNAIQPNFGPICSTSFQAAMSLCLSFFWPQFLLPISISTCQSVAHLFSALACPALLQRSVTDFHQFFFWHLHINSRPSRLPSQGAGNGEKVAKA